MKYRVRKWFVDFEKEEKWLNEMAQRGMNFTDYRPFKYTFEKGAPGEYTYRLELLKELPSNPESKAYIDFMEENGVECVTTFMRWAYFRKKSSEGEFDIYSDMDSKIMHYKRVAALIGALGGMNIAIGVFNYANWWGFGHARGIEINLYSGSVSMLVGAALVFFMSIYIRKIGRLKRDKQLYE